jgi:hypothetical protein
VLNHYPAAPLASLSPARPLSVCPSLAPSLAQHLVFMGSSRFPGENELDDFVSSHGGGVNAFTEEEYTVYQVDVAPSALEGAFFVGSGGGGRERRPPRIGTSPPAHHFILTPFVSSQRPPFFTQARWTAWRRC